MTPTALDKGKTFGGVEIQAPLKISRLNVLNRRGNVLVSQKPRDDQGEARAIIEIFWVLSRTADELSDWFQATQDEWDEAVDLFGIQAEAGVDEFTAALESEFEELKGDEEDAGEPAPEGLPGKRETSASNLSPPPSRRDLPTTRPPTSQLPGSLASFAQDLPQEENAT